MGSKSLVLCARENTVHAIQIRITFYSYFVLKIRINNAIILGLEQLCKRIIKADQGIKWHTVLKLPDRTIPTFRCRTKSM